jgi:hypothetical protein
MNIANDSSHVAAVPGLLRELEIRLDQAYAALNDLGGALPRARIEAKFSGVVGQSVLRQVSSAGSSIIEARGQIVAVHRLLEKLSLSAGIEVATGDERPKGQDDALSAPFTTGQVSTIGAVA